VKELSGFDVVILGAIGPVFGDYFSTLSTLAKCIKEKGIFIIDDGFIDDNSDFSHPLIFKKSDLLQQIEKAGMELVEIDIFNRDDIIDSDNHIFDTLKKRCLELIEKYPKKKNLFLDYIRRQEIENDVLENKVICTNLVIKKNK
jgi:hypothetical protein